MVPTFRLEPASGDAARRRTRELIAALAEGWRAGLESGLIVYDPAGPDVEVVRVPPFRYHYLPGRAVRPNARRDTPPPLEGIRAAHAPCPFDGEEFVREREVVRLERGGRTYHVTANRYPVTPRHFLPVRSYAERADTLPQHLHGPEEIEDMILLLALAGPPHRVYFNSNRGADDSQSGSSVNHWHWQLFPLAMPGDCPFFSGAAAALRVVEGVTIGRVAGWPARHVLVEGGASDFPGLARAMWHELSRLHALNAAYNLEGVEYPGGRFRLTLFPRHPAPPLEVPGAGSLSPNFGGWELTGDIVIPTREILEWIRAHPTQARDLTARRLVETTREI